MQIIWKGGGRVKCQNPCKNLGPYEREKKRIRERKKQIEKEFIIIFMAALLQHIRAANFTTLKLLYKSRFNITQNSENHMTI